MSSFIMAVMVVLRERERESERERRTYEDDNPSRSFRCAERGRRPGIEKCGAGCRPRRCWGSQRWSFRRKT